MREPAARVRGRLGTGHRRAGARSLTIGVSAMALALAGIVGSAPPAGAEKTPFAAQGAVQCTYSLLQFKVAPGLTFTPAAQTMTFRGVAHCRGTTGRTGVTVTGAKVNGTVQIGTPVTCTSLLGIAPPEPPTASPATAMLPVFINGNTRWRARGGKLRNSQLAFDSYRIDGNVWSAPATGGDGTIASGGSYAGEHPSSSVTLTRIWGGSCSGKGVKKLGFAFGGFKIEPGGS